MGFPKPILAAEGRSRGWFDQSSPLINLFDAGNHFEDCEVLYPENTMAATQHLHLAPFLAETGKFDKLVESGQTLSAAISPLDDSIAAYLKNTVGGRGSIITG